MAEWNLIRVQLLTLSPFVAAAVILIWWRRWLTPGALRRCPGRDIGLGPRDVLIGLGLALLGGVLSAVLVAGVPRGEDGELRFSSPLWEALATAAGQVLFGAPIAAFLVYRARAAPRGLFRIGLAPRRPLRDAAVAAAGLLIALPLVFTSVLLAGGLGLLLDRPAPTVNHPMLDSFMNADQGVRAVLAFSAVILAPLFEEIFYRGLIQTALVSLAPRRRWLCVVGVSIAFALQHAGLASWHALPALGVLSVILGWLYERTGSLWPSILVHAGFNAVNLALALMQQRWEAS